MADIDPARTVTTLEEIQSLAKDDSKLQKVLDHMEKRGIDDILYEIKEVLYVDDDEIYVGAIKALPYLYYNYVSTMDYYRNTMTYFDDFTITSVDGDTKENLSITIEDSDNNIGTHNLKEFCDLSDPSCKYITYVNGGASLCMPPVITEDSVYEAIKCYLLDS